MNKERFMIELERLLRGLPAEEKEDALNYYREYIEDAGFSDIDDVTDKLGTPKSVARSILGESVDKYVEEQKESKILEGHMMSDHIHMLIQIPPKYSVAQVIGYIKGKSAIYVARRYGERQRYFTGQHMWARGYFVTTVGLDENVIRNYIRDQEEEDRRQDGQQ